MPMKMQLKAVGRPGSRRSAIAAAGAACRWKTFCILMLVRAEDGHTTARWSTITTSDRELRRVCVVFLLPCGCDGWGEPAGLLSSQQNSKEVPSEAGIGCAIAGRDLGNGLGRGAKRVGPRYVSPCKRQRAAQMDSTKISQKGVARMQVIKAAWKCLHSAQVFDIGSQHAVGMTGGWVGSSAVSVQWLGSPLRLVYMRDRLPSNGATPATESDLRRPTPLYAGPCRLGLGPMKARTGRLSSGAIQR